MVEYTLTISKRARKLTLSIYSGGHFVVTKPSGMADHRVERFMQSKAKWIVEKINRFMKFPSALSRKVSQPLLVDYREQALIFVEKRVQHFNQIYGFNYKKISVKNQKSRWGSCSSKGNLNFNFKIVLLPDRLADYIIVHELCHIGQLNHSKKFWDLVEKTLPHYKILRNELKKIR